ncbi:MAG: hypothetical protein ACQ9MH_22585 [Nitrospinales bacterium]
MPRRYRIDAPGALHHIIARGIYQAQLSQKLKISQPAVSQTVRRDEQLAHRNRYSLED